MASSDPRTTKVLLLVLAGALGYLLWDGELLEGAGLKGVKGRQAEVQQMQDSVALLQSQVDSAKRELANGTAEDLRRKLEGYRSSLALMRRLVPERNEVPNLLDDMSTRAKIRGVTLSQVTPLPVQPGPAPFDTYKYNVSVIGHYDQIGEFLADVATLQRIIVPTDVAIATANQAAAKALGDSTGALLEAKFVVRTYVKSAPDEGGETSGT